MRGHFIKIIILSMILWTQNNCSSGLQVKSPSDFDYQALPNPMRAAYQVKPGDVLHVRVIRNDNLTGTYTIGPDGCISLSLIGEINVGDLTIEAVRERLVKSLAKYIDGAEEMVSVSLEQTHGLAYSVIGETNRPGVFESPRYVTILEALANAGGLTVYAESEGIYVLRRTGAKEVMIPVSYSETIKKPSSNRNFYLLAGDIVVVP